MVTVEPLTLSDVDWAVEVLARRRSSLVPHAPVLWRQASDATKRHAEWLHYLLSEGGAVGYRTEDGLMLAAPGRQDWTIDDAWVAPDAWERQGLSLWGRIVVEIGARPLRFVCPTSETERTRFATGRGLTLTTSWWHTEVPITELEAEPGQPQIEGAGVSLVSAPPVYDPGGPITFLQGVVDVRALERAPAEAARCGSPLVVVDQPAEDLALALALTRSGYIRHCDFFSGHG